MTQALHTLLQHTERQRDQQRTQVMQVEEQVRRLEAQAGQLHSYRDESQARHPALGGRSATLELLRCHQGFMQRLDQAIAQQRTQFLAAQARVATQRNVLLGLEMRAASVRKLIERRDADLRQREAQREQRRSDDAAARSRGRGTDVLGGSMNGSMNGSMSGGMNSGMNGGLAAGWRATTQAAPL